MNHHTITNFHGQKCQALKSNGDSCTRDAKFKFLDGDQERKTCTQHSQMVLEGKQVHWVADLGPVATAFVNREEKKDNPPVVERGITCGNCKGKHNTVDEVKACVQSKTGQVFINPTVQNAKDNYDRDLERVFTVTCQYPPCKNTKTGPKKDLINWRCDEHPKK